MKKTRGHNIKTPSFANPIQHFVESEKGGTLDLSKWMVFLVTIFASLLFAGSVFFRNFYWSRTGIDPAMLPLSAIEMATLGFTRLFSIFIFTLIFVIIFIGILISLNFIKHNRRDLNQTHQRLTLLQIELIVALWGILLLVYLVLAIYVVKIDAEKSLNKEVCEANKIYKLKMKFPTTVYLENKEALSGKYLERTEKFGVLINQNGFYVITASEKPRVLDITDLPNVECDR